MINQNHISKIGIFILFTCLFGFSNQALAQCAGLDNTVTVCEKELDVANRTFDLNAQLLGSPTAGGEWSTADTANLGALDPITGILDLWAINYFGAHEFIYTNNSCGETATVTINLGGYPGENNTDGSANACENDTDVNLHGFLGSDVAGRLQDFNGSWSVVPATAATSITDNSFNATTAGPGVYTFSYTVDAVDTCPSRIANIVLEVHPNRVAGTPSDLMVCVSDDLSTNTNFNLRSLLDGESPNGSWTEGVTNQISSANDNRINIEEIRDNFGVGTYTFTYTVLAAHPVCSNSTAEVNITIQNSLSGTLSSPNYCDGDTYEITLDYDSNFLDNGSYDIAYELFDGTDTVTNAEPMQLTDGTATFTISAASITPNVIYNLRLTHITGLAPVVEVCNNIDVPAINFTASSSGVAISDVCINEDGTADITNILSDAAVLLNSTENVTYTLTDSQSTVTSFTANAVVFTDGDGTIAIPAANLTIPGNYTISVVVENALDLNCAISNAFTLNPIPADMTLDLIVDNSCNTQIIDVAVDAPVLTSGSYEITYEVTPLGDPATVLLTTTQTSTGGVLNYDLDVTTLANGNYTAYVRSTQDDTTPCRTVFDFDTNIDFAIGGISLPPQAELEQTFCLDDYAPNNPTLADVVFTGAGEARFYDTATDMNILPMSTELVDGEDYFIATIDTNFNCQESQRISVTVTVASPGVPTSTMLSPNFCASDNPTIADLTVVAGANETIVWYDAATNGTVLDNTTALVEGQSYFAESEINGVCQGPSRLELTPIVTTFIGDILNASSYVSCSLDNPTIDDLIAFENNNDGWRVEWFESATGGTSLNSSTLLVNGTTYYAETYHIVSGCIVPTRSGVAVDLSDCDPQEYGFFIPDGFSPNGDGRNDTFFVPNIEIIFPDFTIEILNRYGNTLFEGDRSNPAWDGTNAGDGSTTLPSGVYFYIINYNKQGFDPVQGRLYLNQ